MLTPSCSDIPKGRGIGGPIYWISFRTWALKEVDDLDLFLLLLEIVKMSLA